MQRDRLLKTVDSHLNIKLSRRGGLEVRMAGVLVRWMHDEDQRQLGPSHAAAKEAGEGDCVGVDTCRLHGRILQRLTCTALPHDHHSHRLVPPEAWKAVLAAYVTPYFVYVCCQFEANTTKDEHRQSDGA